MGVRVNLGIQSKRESVCGIFVYYYSTGTIPAQMQSMVRVSIYRLEQYVSSPKYVQLTS